MEQYRVLMALGRLHPEAAIRALVAVVRDPGSPDRRTAIQALGHYGAQASIEEALLDVLPGETDPDVQYEIVQVLASVGTARSIPALEAFLKKPAKRLSKR